MLTIVLRNYKEIESLQLIIIQKQIIKTILWLCNILGSVGKNSNNNVAVNAKIPVEKNSRIRRVVNGVLMKATGPKSATSDDARILVTDGSVVDKRNTGNQQVWLAGGHRKHDGCDGMTHWNDKPAKHQTVTCGIVTEATGPHRYSCTCEFIQGLVSKMPVTFPRRLSTNNINRFQGQTVVSNSKSKCYDAKSAMNFQRNDGSTKGAVVVSSANTDTVTILRNSKKRSWLKKLFNPSNFLVTRKMMRISVSHGTIAPKRFNMTRRTTNNGLRKFSVTNKIQKKISRKFRKLNSSPVTKAVPVKCSSTMTTATWYLVRHSDGENVLTIMVLTHDAWCVGPSISNIVIMAICVLEGYPIFGKNMVKISSPVTQTKLTVVMRVMWPSFQNDIKVTSKLNCIRTFPTACRWTILRVVKNSL